jgi:hypothetical protein
LSLFAIFNQEVKFAEAFLKLYSFPSVKWGSVDDPTNNIVSIDHGMKEEYW